MRIKAFQRCALPVSTSRLGTFTATRTGRASSSPAFAREVSVWRNGASSWLAGARSGQAVGFGRERRAAVHARAAPAGRREHPTVELSAFVPNRLKQLSPEGLPLVVVLHGLLGNSNNWRSMLTRADCCPGMYTVSVDLRNHGKSGWAQTNTFAEMSDDVIDFAEGFGVREACLVGHSLGGKVAMHLALQYPEKVRSLVVVDIAPVDYAGSMMHESILQGMASLDLGAISSTADAREKLMPFVEDAAVREFVLTNLTLDSSSKKYSWKVNLDALVASIRDGSLSSFPVSPGARYDGPCLFIRGARSGYMKDEYTARILELFPQAEFETMDTGHWPHAEVPSDFLAVLNDWFMRPENQGDASQGGGDFFPRT